MSLAQEEESINLMFTNLLIQTLNLYLKRFKDEP